MTLYAKAGTLTTPTSIGNQTISGLGFTPVAVIIWGDANTATGWGTDFQHGIGFSAYNSAKSAYQQGAIAWAGQTGETNGNEFRRHAAVSFTLLQYDGSLILVEGTITTMSSANSGEFIIAWATVDTASGFMLNYLALGGSDLEAGVLQWQTATTTGNHPVTGLGFTPTCAIHMGVGVTSAPPTSTTYSAYHIGAMTGSGNQWAIYEQSNPGGGPANTRQQFSNYCVSRNTSFDVLAEYDVFGNDGFTLKWDEAVDGTGPYIWSLCLGGVSIQAGTWSKTTTSGTNETDGISTSNMTPVAVIASTISYVAESAAYENSMRFCFGASDGTNNVCSGGTEENGGSTSVVHKYEYSNKSICVSDNDSGAADITATIGSFVNGGFTVTWGGTNTATATQICYVAICALNATPALATIGNTSAVLAPTPAIPLNALSLTTIGSTSAPVTPTPAIPLNKLSLTPIGSTSAPVTPTPAIPLNKLSLTPIGTTTAAIAPSLRADCNLPSSVLATIGSTSATIAPSLRADCSLTISTLRASSATIAPSLRADCSLTISTLSASSATIAPTLSMRIALTLATITNTSAAISAAVARADANLSLSTLNASSAAIAASVTRADCNLTSTPISATSQAISATISQADCNLPALTPVSSTAATVQPTITESVALTLSTINNTAAIVSVTPTTAIALTLATLAASASTISPSVGIGVDIILSTLGLTSAVIPVSPQAAGRVNIVLSPIGTNTSVIAPHITADANLTVPTLNASASAITPSVAMVIHIIMATLGVSATAIAPEITADCNLTLSPIATSASTFDVSVAISIMLAVLAAESAMLVNNETLSIYNPATNELWAAEAVAPISIENEILIAGLALQEITTLLANESVAPAANVNEDVTIIDEEGNETSGNVLENIWRPAAVPQVETLVITETSSVEAIPEE